MSAKTGGGTSERQLSDLLAEHAALHEVAVAVATEPDPRTIFRVVTEHAARLAGASWASVTRFDPGGTATVVGGVLLEPQREFIYEGEVVPLDDETVSALVYRIGGPARIDYRTATGRTADLARKEGAREALGVPIRVGGQIWGAMTIGTVGQRVVPAGTEERLEGIAELLGLGIANADAIEQLVKRAATDPLTDLVNHRAFHERLREELARALRHGHPLSLVLFDVDGFERVNDRYGHQIGDETLLAIARCLRGAVRESDVLARLGGDEFALLAIQAAAPEAYGFAERCRVAVSEARVGPDRDLTISGGVCDITQAVEPETLVRLADGALYWAKTQGRDTIVSYRREVVHELSAAERAERLARSQSMTAIRALARAVDAKDHSTHEHSERVSALARGMAAASGWPEERIVLLAQAALIHDVGKIGIPDRILLKPGRLDRDEYEHVKQHSILGAEIAAEALDPEQVAWVRHHHERYDGAGYPDGLAGDAIPAGACILALADAWDVMTSERSYSPAKPPALALEECRRAAGSQFCPAACGALEAALG